MNNSELMAKKGISYDESTKKYSFTESVPIDRSSVFAEANTESDNKDLPSVIYPLIRAITLDKVTRNSTYYSKEEMSKSISSWIKPFPVPVLLNHKEYTCDPIGRVIGSKIDKNYLSLVPYITDKNAIEKILDGRYNTVSIGVDIEDAECSICGKKQFSEGYCDHWKGERYKIPDGKNSFKEVVCYFKAIGPTAREVSYVNVPSDNEAGTLVNDLGPEGAKKWLTTSDASAPMNESVSEPITSLKSLVKGFQLAESFDPNKGRLNNMSDARETLTKIPDLSSKEKIVKAGLELNKHIDEKLNVTAEVATAISEAIKTAGISNKHAYRLVLSETEGIPFITREGVSQADITVTQLEALLVESDVKEKELTEKVTSLETKVSELESQLQETEVPSLKAKVSDLESKLSAALESSKSILVSSVATEMIRNKYPLAQGKSYSELSDILKLRSNEYLINILEDLSIIPASSPSTEKVTNPVVSEEKTNTISLSKIDDFLKKLKPESNEDVVNKEGLVVSVTEKETLKVELDKNGMFTVTPEGFTPSDSEKENIDSQVLNLKELL